METRDAQSVPEHHFVVLPMVAQKRPEKRRPEPGRATREEAARASQTMPDRYIAAAMEKATSSEKLMIRLGAECGLRRGEIARVHSDDVVADSAGRSLIVRGKGDKQRIVPLPDDLADIIIMDARGYSVPWPVRRPCGGVLYRGPHQSSAAGRIRRAHAAPPVRHHGLRRHTRPVRGRRTARP